MQNTNKTFFQENRVILPEALNYYANKKAFKFAGKSFINWPKRLASLITDKKNNSKAKSYERRHKEAVALAGSWVTCACGNQCAIIPRDSYGEPLDVVLADLGFEFNNLIGKRKYTAALKTLEKIEKRSIELIKQIKTDKNV